MRYPRWSSDPSQPIPEPNGILDRGVRGLLLRLGALPARHAQDSHARTACVCVCVCSKVRHALSVAAGVRARVCENPGEKSVRVFFSFSREPLVERRCFLLLFFPQIFRLAGAQPACWLQSSRSLVEKTRKDVSVGETPPLARAQSRSRSRSRELSTCRRRAAWRPRAASEACTPALE